MIKAVFKLGIFIFTISLLAGCTKDDEIKIDPLSDKIVVEAYVYANEPAHQIHIAKVNNSGTADLIPIGDATVILTQGEHEIVLSDSTQNAGIYTQADSSAYVFTDSAVVHLKVKRGDKTYTSHSTFPGAISGLQISNTAIATIPGNSAQTVATLSWDPVNDAAGYCLFIRNVTSNYGPIEQTKPEPSAFHKVFYTPSVELKSTDFSFTGNFEIYVTAITDAYAAVYSENTNSMTDGASNIENGWGIFTAFNGSAVEVSVE